MLHAECLGNRFQVLELHDWAVGEGFLHLLAVFDIHIVGAILLVVLYGEAVAVGGAAAAEAVHLRTDYINTHLPHCVISRQDFAMRCHNNCGERLNSEFFHFVDVFARVYHLLEAAQAFTEALNLPLTFQALLLERFHSGRMGVIVVERANLLERKAEILEGEDAVEALHLRDGVVAVAAAVVHLGGYQQPERLVVPQCLHRYLHQARKLSDFQFCFFFLHRATCFCLASAKLKHDARYESSVKQEFNNH